MSWFGNVRETLYVNFKIYFSIFQITDVKMNIMEVYERQEYEAYNMLQQALDLYKHKVQTLEMTWAIIENVAEDDEFMEWDTKYVGRKELKLVNTDEIQQVALYFSFFSFKFC